MLFPQAKHANGEHLWGINGDTGKIVDMKQYGLYESASVQVRLLTTPFVLECMPLTDTYVVAHVQTLKMAIEAAGLLLRVDDIVKATRKDREQGGGGGGAPAEEMMER